MLLVFLFQVWDLITKFYQRFLPISTIPNCIALQLQNAQSPFCLTKNHSSPKLITLRISDVHKCGVHQIGSSAIIYHREMDHGYLDTK